jgi:rhodanese-related sulfurtransferase
MSTTFRTFEWIANTLSILAALAIAAILVKPLLVSSDALAAEAVAAGAAAPIPGVDWSAHDTTVVLALSVTCGYCTASMPFYKDLLEAAVTRDVHVVAVFPQSGVAGRAYLETNGVDIKDVRELALDRLGIQGTPTVMLVRRDGIIGSGWTGKLSATQESEVFEQLGLQRPSRRESAEATRPPATSRATAAELADIFRSGEDVPIIDIRERGPFTTGHIAGALNIPFSELEVRAPVELPSWRPVFVYCRYSSTCENGAAASGASTWCAMTEHVLKSAGLTDVRAIVGDLQELKTAGVTIAGDATEEPLPAAEAR